MVTPKDHNRYNEYKPLQQLHIHWSGLAYRREGVQMPGNVIPPEVLALQELVRLHASLPNIGDPTEHQITQKKIAEVGAVLRARLLGNAPTEN
jgi:hypothetical protein